MITPPGYGFMYCMEYFGVALGQKMLQDSLHTSPQHCQGFHNYLETFMVTEPSNISAAWSFQLAYITS